VVVAVGEMRDVIGEWEWRGKVAACKGEAQHAA